jgi:hypothetical protein
METAEIDIRVGQLWRRRLDGRRSIPVHRVADGWLDRAGIKPTESDLRQKHVLVTLDAGEVVGRERQLAASAIEDYEAHVRRVVAPA